MPDFFHGVEVKEITSSVGGTLAPDGASVIGLTGVSSVKGPLVVVRSLSEAEQKFKDDAKSPLATVLKSLRVIYGELGDSSATVIVSPVPDNPDLDTFTADLTAASISNASVSGARAGDNSDDLASAELDKADISLAIFNKNKALSSGSVTKATVKSAKKKVPGGHPALALSDGRLKGGTITGASVTPALASGATSAQGVTVTGASLNMPVFDGAVPSAGSTDLALVKALSSVSLKDVNLTGVTIDSGGKVSATITVATIVSATWDALPDTADYPANTAITGGQISAGTITTELPSGAVGAVPTASIAGNAGDFSGVYGLLRAKNLTGYTPKILIAPSFSHDPAVRDALRIVAGQLRGEAIVEGPPGSNVTEAEVIAFFKDIANSRLYGIWPRADHGDGVGVLGTSAAVAGLMARTDYDFGYWTSPSNRAFESIKSLEVPVGFSMYGDSMANNLNAARVATIINEQGFRLWGNRTLFDANDPLDAQHMFLNVRRTRDEIDGAILAAHFKMVDRNITRTYVIDIIEELNEFFRTMKARDAIVDGAATIKKELNSAADIQNGHVTFDYEFTALSPAERLTFRSLLSNRFIAEIFPS